MESLLSSSLQFIGNVNQWIPILASLHCFLSHKLLIPHTHKDRFRIVSENVKAQLFFFPFGGKFW